MDNDDVFERLDFTTDEMRSDAPWVQQARGGRGGVRVSMSVASTRTERRAATRRGSSRFFVWVGGWVGRWLCLSNARMSAACGKLTPSEMSSDAPWVQQARVWGVCV